MGCTMTKNNVIEPLPIQKSQLPQQKEAAVSRRGSAISLKGMSLKANISLKAFGIFPTGSPTRHNSIVESSEGKQSKTSSKISNATIDLSARSDLNQSREELAALIEEMLDSHYKTMPPSRVTQPYYDVINNLLSKLYTQDLNEEQQNALLKEVREEFQKLLAIKY